MTFDIWGQSDLIFVDSLVVSYRGVGGLPSPEAPVADENEVLSSASSIRTRTRFPETWLWESLLVNGYFQRFPLDKKKPIHQPSSSLSSATFPLFLGAYLNISGDGLTATRRASCILLVLGNMIDY